jgi:amidase
MSINFGAITHGAKVDKSVLEPFTLGLAETFSKRKLKLISSINTLTRSAKKTEAEMEEKYDIIMTAVTTKRTPEIGYFSPNLDYKEIAWRGADFASFLPLFNISGSPAISLPMGTATNDMPVGVQFVAPYGQDKLLLEMALQLEQAKPWKFIYD